MINKHLSLLAILLAAVSCGNGPKGADPQNPPVLPDVEEPTEIEDVRPETLPAEPYSPSLIGKTYYPIEVMVGPSSPGAYTKRKARIVANLDGFDYARTRAQYVSETDRFGGTTTMPQQQVTGRFYITKIDGRFWFVDPLGHPFYLRGVSSLTTEGADSPRNKAAFAEKYGGDSQKWLDDVHSLFEMNGIHATCAFLKDDSAIREYNRNHPTSSIVYAPSVAFLNAFRKKYYASAESTTDLCLKKEWPAFCEEYVAQVLANYKGDRNVLGFFSDNEITLTEAGAEAYYKGIHDAVKKFDPRMLYFGSRVHGSYKSNQTIMTAAGKWCDAVGVNYYGDWSPDLTGKIASWAEWMPETPVIITEFYTKGEDSGLSNRGGAGLIVPDEHSRAYAYQHFTLGLLEAKNIAGWVWFRYMDDPENGDKPSNKGLFDNDYEIYPFLAMYMRNINYNVYRLTEYFDK